MPERQPRFDSGGISASQKILSTLAKHERDEIFYRPDSLSFDFKEVLDEERAQGFRITHEIGGRGCRILKHPGSKIPLLTKKSCGYTKEFGPKQAGDTELNLVCSETMKKGSQGRGGGGLPSAPVSSQYRETIGKEVSLERRLKAKPPAVSGDCSREVSGRFFVTRSHYQREHGDNLTGAPSFFMKPVRPVNNLEAPPQEPDFWNTRYQVEHCAAGDVAGSPSRQTRVIHRRRSSSQGGLLEVPREVTQLLGETKQSLKLTGPGCGRVACVPATLIGSPGPGVLRAMAGQE